MQRFTLHLQSWYQPYLIRAVSGLAILALLAPQYASSSSWSPTLLVNTEAFQVIDSGDGTTDMQLQFGSNSQTITYLTSGRFQFNKSISVLGTVSGSALNIDHNATIGGNLAISGTLSVNNISLNGSLSGRSLRVSGPADVHGLLVASGAIRTESGIVLNSDLSAVNANLIFGNSVQSQTLKYLHTAQKFQFSTGLSVLGTLSGSSLNIDRNATVGGSMVSSGSFTTKSHLSGASLNVSRNTTIGGTLVSSGTITGKSTISGSSLNVSRNGTVGGTFVASGTITGKSTISGAALNVSRNATVGGTLTVSGTLSLVSGLNARGSLSGYSLRVSGPADVHGLLVASGAIRTQTGIVLNSDATAADAILTFGNFTANQTIKFLNTSQKFQFSKGISVLGNISGSTLTVDGKASISGALIVKQGLTSSGAVTVRGVLSGTSLVVTKNAAFASGVTITKNLVVDGSGLVVNTATNRVSINTATASTGGSLTVSGATVMIGRSDPSKPSGNVLDVYANNFGGRMMLKTMGPTGSAFALQPALFEKSITHITTNQKTTVTSVGDAVTSAGTISHPAATEAYGYMANFVTAAVANNTAGTGNANVHWFRGSTAGANGFFFDSRLALPDATYTSNRTFVGLTSGTMANSVSADNPAGDFAGFQHSTARPDTNWQFMTKDNTTQNLVNTGLAFTAAKVYNFTIYCSPQCTTIYWRIENVTDGTSAEGSTSTNLPRNNIGMRSGFQLQTITATARNIRMQTAYTEADR